MEEQTVNQLDNLLLQLGIETQELVQRKDGIKQQIQMLESSIQEKKDYVNATQKTIKNLDEEINQKQDTVKFIKENTKNLQHTGNLMLQYEKTLESELEKRQDSYNQDTKIFQERMESYRDVFQQYKDSYCLNPVARKLLQIQADNEEIEKRIRETESQIVEKERELIAALGVNDPVSISDGADSNYSNSKCPESEALQTDNNEPLGELDCQQDPEMQGLAEEADDRGMIVEEFSEEKDREDMSESDTEMFNYGSWPKSDTVEDPINQKGDQKQSEMGNEQEENMKSSCVETLEENDGDDVEKSKAGALEETASEGVICPPSSPARMKAVPTTPTFSLNNSPCCSPGQPNISESKSPAFVFSVNSAPNTPRLGCDFGMGSPAEEASPFTFTSSYFSDKKSPGSGPKFSRFMFDEGESRQEEFSFSFTQQSPSTRPNTAPDDSFPFTFSFGK